MQNFPPSDQALLGAELNKIKSNQELMPPEGQVRAVIIQLAKFLGPEFVLNVIRDNQTLLNTPPPDPADAVLAEAKQQLAEQGQAGAGR